MHIIARMDVSDDRQDKLEQLREAGQAPFPLGTSLSPRRFIDEICAEHDPDAEVPATVVLAGRVMSKRDHGNSLFLDVKDATGRLQVYVQKKVVSPEVFGLFKDALDLGDHVAVQGGYGRTRKGEVTVFAEALELVSKTLVAPPKEHFGLADVEARLRQRYVDLSVNADSFARFGVRSAMVTAMRRTLEDKRFLEVETPMLHPIAGGATARPFVTHHNTLDIDLFLRIAPELYLKRLLVGGFERVFEIGRNFRNEGISPRHNPEFTMLEAYWAYARAEDWMTTTETMIADMVATLGASAREEGDADTVLRRGEQELDMRAPFRRATYGDLLAEHAGADIFDDASIDAAAAKHGIGTQGRPREKVIDDLFDATVQDHLVEPTFVTHFPVSMSPLAKVSADDDRLAERFELFVAGMEIANGFAELNDPAEQERRFIEQVAAKDPEFPGEVDHDYVHALACGMPPAAGIGIGVDRLAMLLTNTDTIRDVILFPLLRPVNRS